MPVAEKVNDAYWSTFKWPSQMLVNLEDAKLRLKVAEKNILGRIEVEKGFVIDSISEISQDIIYFETLNDITQSDATKLKMKPLEELVSSTIALSASVKKQQQIMKIPEIVFSGLAEVAEIFHRYQKLWTLVDEARTFLNLWVNEWFMNLNAELMVSKVHTWNFTIKELIELPQLEGNSRLVVLQLKEDVDDFWRNANVITALRNPALKFNHWDQIRDIIGLSLIDFQSLHLFQILDLDLELVQSVISDISHQADVSHKLEITLEKMKLDLSSRDFQFCSIFESDNLYISNGEDACIIIEDQLIHCESIFLSIDDADSKLKFEKWVSQIHRALEMMQAIMELQDFYLHFKPIISSPSSVFFPADVVDSFVAVSKIFGIVSDIFLKNKKFINLIYRSDLYDLIAGSSTRMKNCINGAKTYLEAKRSIFPRFYFVSDKIMIETLSSTNIATLSGLISLYFPTMARLCEKNLSEKIHKTSEKIHSKGISGIIGHDGEVLMFENFLPFNSTTVELELGFIEENSSKSLRIFFLRALTSLKQNGISGIQIFVEQYPLQVSLLALRVYWSQEVQILSASKDRHRLKDFKVSLSHVQQLLIDLCQQNEISGSLRVKVEAFLTLSFEFLSLFDEYFLIDVCRRAVFDCDEEGRISIGVSGSPKVQYAFEYLGVGSRLAITPTLTNSFFKILNALNFGTGAIVSGLYCSGKSTTIKELGYLVGVPVIFESCVDISSSRLHSLLEGHLKSLCWLVLNDINHLNDNNLLEFTKANQTRKKLLPILGTINNIEDWHGIPSSIRSHYRLLGIMEPNFSVAIEAVLVTHQFNAHKLLAKKIHLFKTTSRLLLAPFITFNLHLMKKVIKSAILLRDEQKSAQENSIFAQAIFNSIKESISTSDAQAVKEMLSSIFHYYGDFHQLSSNANQLLRQLKLKKLSSSDYLLQKIANFVNLIERAQSSIIIVGENMSGKSTIWKIGLNLQNDNHGRNAVKAFHSFPNTILHCSENFVLRKVLDNALKHSKDMKKETNLDKTFSWVIFDGEMSVQWFELLSGEMTKNVKNTSAKQDIQLIYEVTNLSGSTPSMLSKTCIIFMDTKQLKVDMLVSNYLLEAPPNIFKSAQLITGIFCGIVTPAIRFMQSDDTWSKTFCSEKVAIARIFALFLALLEEKGTKGYEKLTANEQSLWVYHSLLFCIIWSVGADYQYEKRIQFDTFFKTFLSSSAKLLEELEQTSDLPVGSLINASNFPPGSVFDFVVGRKLIQWSKWPTITQKTLTGNENVVLPTNDAVKSNFFTHLFMRYKRPFLLNGQQGIGKSFLLSTAIKDVLRTSKRLYEPEIVKLYCNSQTSCESFQSEICRHLHKKRSNARGSQEGKRKVVFIDDLDSCVPMYVLNGSGVLESTRMLLDSGYWYSSKGESEKITNIQLCGTILSTSSRPEVDQRWARYYSIISLDDNVSHKLTEIFEKALLKKLKPIFSIEVPKSILFSTIELLANCQSTFLPVPNFLQYTFNMKDATKVIRGLLNYPLYYSTVSDLLHQWVHCSFLAFKSRIQGDQTQIDEMIDLILLKHFGLNLKSILSPAEPLLYVQPDIIILDSETKGDLRVRDIQLFEKCIRTKHTWNPERDNYCLTTTVIQQAAHLAFMFNNLSTHVTLYGQNYLDFVKLVHLAAYMSKRKCFIIPPLDSNESWNSIVLDVFSTLMSSKSQLVLIYIPVYHITLRQWQDVTCMEKFGVPQRVIEKLGQFVSSDDIENICRKRLKFCFAIPEIEKEEFQKLVSLHSILISSSIIYEIPRINESMILEIVLYNLGTKELPFDSLSKFLYWITHDTPLYLQTEFCHDDSWEYVPSDYIRTIIQVFSKEYCSREKILEDCLKRYQLALDKIEYSFTCIQGIQLIYDHHTEVYLKGFNV